MVVLNERQRKQLFGKLARLASGAVLFLSLSACNLNLSIQDQNSAPQVTFVEVPEYFKGGSQQTLQVSITGAEHITSVALEFSTDGISYTKENTEVTLTGSTLSWPVPALDTEQASLRLKVTDKYGKTHYYPSRIFNILTQAPTAPTVTLDSPSITNSREITIANSHCDNHVTGIFISESASIPNAQDPQWLSCEAKDFTFEISDVQGAHNIYVYVKDAAGNISTSSGVTTTYDSIVPTLVLTSLNNGIFKGGSSQSITWTATGSDLAINPISLEYRTLADSQWQILTSATLNDGTHSWTLPAISDAAVQVRVRAYDLAGNFAEAVSIPGFVIDSTAPTLSLTSFNGGNYIGGTEHAITWMGSDNFSLAANPVSLDYTTDASVATPIWISINSTYTNSGSYSWTLPAINSDKVQVRVRLTDAAGNTTETVSTSNFTIDSTAPAAPVFTRTSAAISGSATLQYAMTCTADFHKILISDSATTPAASHPNWTDCAATGSFVVNTGDGLKTVYAFSKDAAGNISSSNNISFTLDQTKPTLSATPFNTIGAVIGGGSGTLQWTTSDIHAAPTPVSLRVTTDGTNWTTLLSGSSATSYNWTAPAGNCLTCKFEISAIDLAGNIQVVESAFVVDSTPPEVASVLINDGAEYAGGALINIKANITDAAPSAPYQFQVTQDTTGTCPAAVPTKWVPWSDVNSIAPHMIPPIDATINICVWAKDGVGQVSLSAGTGTIEYRRGSPPIITNFAAVKSGGNTSLTVSASDNDVFINNAVSLSYSEDGENWLDISTGNNIEDPAQIHWQNTTGQPPWNFTHVGTPAGVVQYRAVVKDKATNTSLPMKSQLLNADGWSIYAGNNDLGDNGTGLGARWYYQGKGASFAVNPKNNDIYFFHSHYGIRKYSSQKGTVEMFIKHGSNNLGTADGILDNLSRVDTGGTASISFDKNGLLYLNTAAGSGVFLLYQINPEDKSYSLYAGGGNDGASENLTSIKMFSSPLQFDDENSLYMLAYCQNHADPWTADYSGAKERRLIKIRQNAGTQKADSLETVLGKCGGPAFAYGANAKDVSFRINYSRLTSFTVFNNGQAIYFGGAENNTLGGMPSAIPRIKVINGVIYDFGHAARSISYNAVQNLVYFANSSGLHRFTPQLNGNTETVTKISNINIGSSCSQDNIDLADACLTLDSSQDQLTTGHQLLADGSWENGGTYIRMRVVTSDGRISTLFGTQPFFNNNGTLDKQLISGTMRGIYYKKASEPNLAAFPEGLYFIDPLANVFGRVKPDNTTEVIWGNQFYLGNYKHDVEVNPDTVSSGVSMGGVYSGNAGPLHFDHQGLPWMKTHTRLVRLNADKTIKLASYPAGYWDQQPEGTPAYQMGLAPHGGNANLTAKDGNFFVIGNYYIDGDAAYANNSVTKITYFDFTNNTTKKLMGSALHSTNPAAPATNPGFPLTADVSAPNLPSQSLPNHCSDNRTCYVNYAFGRLYFSEGNKLRYITNPDSPTTASLHTQAVASTVIYNFILNSTGQMAWYLSEWGQLYCLPLEAGQPSWCDGVSNYNSIGYFAPHGSTPNQLTWKDDNTLLYSTGNGFIMQFTLPTGP